ncbi:MAG: FAD-dependent oxidoreductase [Desulfobacterales bacterium]|nr:FAD-dependent oxidoreductase [Desulfobacterales bacterium]
MIDADIVIIGGGPAGMAAAVKAAQHNFKVILMEEMSSLGGKVLRNEAHENSKSPANPIEVKTRQKLFQAIEENKEKIKILTNTEVWSVTDQKVVQFHCKSQGAFKTGTVRGKKLIVAVGATDKIIPFSGWHLPGVFTIGGLNTFVQRGIVPGKNILVAGTGPLQIALAYHLVNAGARVKAIADVSTFKETFHSALGILRNGGLGKLMLGLRYLFKIKGSKIPTHYSYIVKKAIGTDRVEGAEIVKVDKSWRPIPGTEKTIGVDTIATGFNLAPQTEITRMAGCNHTYNDQFGYWMVDRNEKMETSVDGIFVAGDGADIKGYDAAIDEGRTAAIAACEQLGAKPLNNMASLQKKMKNHRGIGSEMSSAAKIRPGIFEVLTDDTIICRCEEIRYKDIKSAVKQGARDVNDIKRRTRLGMGHCQGRFCGQVVNELIRQVSGEQVERKTLTVRPPLKPVPLKAIVGMDDQLK